MIPRFLIFLLFSICLKLSSTLFSLYTSRLLNSLDSYDYSQYNQALALTTVVLAIIVFGVPQVIQKYFTQSHADEIRQNVWTYAMIFRGISFVVGVALVFLALPFTHIENVSLVLALYLVQFLLIIDLSYRAIADATGKFFRFTITDFLVKMGIAIILFLTVSIYDFRIWLYIPILGCAYACMLVVDHVLFYPKTRFSSLKNAISVQKKFTKSVSYLGFAGVLVAFYSGIDILILGQMGYSSADINGYANAYKFYTLFLIIPGIIIPPLASFIFGQNFSMPYKITHQWMQFIGQAFIKIPRKTFIASVGLSVAGAVLGYIIYLLAEIMVRLIDPQLQYPEAVDALRILAVSFVVVFPSSFLSTTFVYLNQERKEFIVTASTVVFAIIAYYYGISQLGVVGAAVATVTYLCFELIFKVYLLVSLDRITDII